MRAPCTIMIGDTMYRPGVDENAFILTVEDEEGTYTLPYIQSFGDMEIEADLHDVNLERLEISVQNLEGGEPAKRSLTQEKNRVKIEELEPGEYTLSATGFDEEGKELFTCQAGGIAVGTVIAALGDSITEGYFGQGFKMDDLDLEAGFFPPEAVSRDQRNYPQYAPTAQKYMPSVNCFTSWMTSLNNSLSEAFGSPFFIANEGWGGHTCADYLQLMQKNRPWRERMEQLKPEVWLLHLGVNDARAKRPAAAVVKDLDNIIYLLTKEYNAEPADILLAKPSFDYQEGMEPILRTYCAEFDKLISERGLSAGPDFFAAYAKDRQKHYGEDTVHPNQEGVDYMAKLWHDAIAKAIGAEVEA